MTYTFKTDCTSATGADIQEMIDRSRQITWETIRKRVGPEVIRDTFGNPTPALKDDWAVNFYKSTYRGTPCYFIEHSAIEYVFTKEV